MTRRLLENSDPVTGRVWLQDETGMVVAQFNLDEMTPPDALVLAQLLSKLFNDCQPPSFVSTDADNMVGPDEACPKCGERDADRLVWQIDMEHVQCVRCWTHYKPGETTGRSDILHRTRTRNTEHRST